MFDLTLAAIAWEPQIRGALAVLIGFVVLCGSVYLLLATNSGARTGLLLAIAGLFGWMSIMGAVWWVYGIGWSGQDPSWHAVELDFDGGAGAVTEVVADDPDFSDWETISEDNPSFGELEAAATDALTTQLTPPPYETASDFEILGMAETGGKPDRASDSMIDRVANKVTNSLRLTHPPHYAVVMVQHTIDQGPVEPGQPPHIAEADPSAPEAALILERDLGNLRLTPAVFTFFCMVVFGVTANVLHRRDKREAENRARTEPLAV
ncbi:MAG: hypothetical protein JJE52_16280 [Acidimicrobiia bacterium]|nr:hypothetical protein [Acidimicrobiia bacterium]